MDATLAALLITLIIDIISKVKATQADKKNTEKTSEALSAVVKLGEEMKVMHNMTMSRLEMLEKRMDFVEANQPAGKSGRWATSH